MKDKEIKKNNDLLTEKEDIIIALTDYLENCNKTKLTIKYTALDKELEYAEGLAKKHLEEVAENTGFEIESQTEFQVVLIKKSPPAFLCI